MAGFELGAPQIATSQATCDATVDLLVAARPQRREVILRNHTGADAYVGPSGVSTSTGLLVAQGDALTLATTAAVYGVTVSGTATFSVMEVYQ